MDETRVTVSESALEAARTVAENQGRMWADLLTAELQWQQAREAVTVRGHLYLAAGLPLERVLDALKVSRSTWYRRVAEVEAARAARLRESDERSLPAS